LTLNVPTSALRGVPQAPLGAPPEGLVRRGDDWLYAEWIDGGWVQRIGADGIATRAAPAPAEAASAPETARVEQSTQ
jgi:hypothetical protein